MMTLLGGGDGWGGTNGGSKLLQCELGLYGSDQFSCLGFLPTLLDINEKMG